MRAIGRQKRNLVIQKIIEADKDHNARVFTVHEPIHPIRDLSTKEASVLKASVQV